MNIAKNKRPKGLKYKIRVVNRSWIKNGENISPETQFKKGQIPWIKGRHPVAWNKGKKGTQGANSGSFRKGDKRNGFNHHSWKGGITPINEKIRRSVEYKKWRMAVYLRDNFTCQCCRIRGVKLEAHHIKEFCNYPDLRMSLENGVTLCMDCHNLTKKGVNTKIK